MRLVDTGRRQSLHSRLIRRGSLRTISCSISTLLLVGMLAGCSTGDVDESRRAETREATRGAILPDVQATKIVEEFFPPTGTPGPTRTPLPTLATLTLATRLQADNSPANEVGSVNRGEGVYAVAEIYGLSTGQTVTGIWTTSDGAEITRSTVNVDRSLDAAWVPLEWNVSGVGSGTYAVYVYVDDVLMNSLIFTVN